MILSWFDAAEAKRFGASLAQFYIQRVPPGAPMNDKKFAQKTKDVLEKMALQVAQFKQTHRLNTYKKAQLGNAFKWALRDGGYEPAYIDRLTEWLVSRI